MKIRTLKKDDFDDWHVLWRGYNDFYRADVPHHVSRLNFNNMVEQKEGVFGLVAVDEEDKPIGFAHVIFHPSTWTDGVYCYLEDLFVANEARGTGTAKALIEGVYKIADARGDVARVDWTTQEFYAPARSLYDQVAKRTSFIRYQRA